MKKVFISFIQMFQQIRRDPMLLAACFSPIAAGFFVRFCIPLLEKNVPVSLTKYYPIFDLLLSITAPVLMCFAFAMITLEETDDKTAIYFSVTPLGKTGYLFSRLGIPALLSMLAGFFVLFFFSLSRLGIMMNICMTVLGAIQAIMVSLMIIALSTNKLEGMAVAKLACLTLLGIPVPFFVNGNLQLAASFLPSFWAAKMVQTGSFLFFIPALLAAALWYGFLGKRLKSKMTL